MDSFVNKALIFLNHTIPHIRASSVVWLPNAFGTNSAWRGNQNECCLPFTHNPQNCRMGIYADVAERNEQCIWLQLCAALWAAPITSVCATSGTKKQLGWTHGVYSLVVFSHSSQNVAQIHIPHSPTQHDLLLDPQYFSTVNLRRTTAGCWQSSREDDTTVCLEYGD